MNTPPDVTYLVAGASEVATEGRVYLAESASPGWKFTVSRRDAHLFRTLDEALAAAKAAQSRAPRLVLKIFKNTLEELDHPLPTRSTRRRAP